MDEKKQFECPHCHSIDTRMGYVDRQKVGFDVDRKTVARLQCKGCNTVAYAFRVYLICED